MKAQELRTGNYLSTVADEDEMLVVDAIDSVEGTLSANGIDDWYIGGVEGIPLTPKWLEKFGFQVEYGYGVIYFLNNDEPIGIEYKRDGSKSYQVIIRNHGSCCDSYEHPKRKGSIQYVHQLQNLFYALTGEELAISQKAENLSSL